MNCLNLSDPIIRKFAAVVGEPAAAAVIDSLPESIQITEDLLFKEYGKLTTASQMVARRNLGELLTPAEARNLYQQYNPSSFGKLMRSWFFKTPTKNNDELEAFKIIDMAHMARLSGKASYGLFLDGVTYLANVGNESSPKVSKKALRHELIHRIMWSYLTAKEREAILQKVAEKYKVQVNKLKNSEGFDNLEAAEEFIAKEFENYRNENTFTLGDKVKMLFKKILRALGLLSLHKTELTDFFNLVESGFFSGSPIHKNIKVTRRMQKEIARRFVTIDNYLNAQRTVLRQIANLNKFNNLEGNDLKKAVPYTFAESINLGYQSIKEELNKINQIILSSEQVKQNPDYAKYLQLMDVVDKARKAASEGTQFTEEQKLKIIKIERAAKDLLKSFNEMSSPLIKSRYNILSSLSNINNYQLIVDTLYPDSSILIDTNINETDEVFNWQNEIGSKEDVDLRNNIIAQVKQLLGTISYKDEKGKVQYVPFNQAYAILLKIMDKFNVNSSSKEMVDYLNAAFNVKGNTPKTLAIKNTIIKIINDSFPSVSNNETYLNFIQFKSDGVVVIDTAVDADKNQSQNLRFVSLDKIKYDINNNSNVRYVLVEKNPGENQKDFVARVYEVAKGIYPNSELINPNNILAGYRMFVNLNLLANVQTSLGTMRERIPRIATRQWQRKKLTYRYVEARESGVKAVYTSQFLQAFINVLEKSFDRKNDPKSEQWKTAEIKRKVNRLLTAAIPINPSAEQKVEFIKNILKLLKVPAIKDSIDVIDNYNKIDVLYEDIVNQIRRFKEMPIGTDIEQVLFYEEMRLITHLTEIFSNLDEATIPTNYIAGDGKTRYMHALSSWGMEVYKYFSKPLAKLKGKMPAYLNTPFYKANAYASGLLSMEYFDHDSQKYAGSDTSAILHKNEKPQQWFVRNFNNMFIGALSVGNSIFQQVYTISDKPNILGAKVNFIKPEQYFSIIAHLIKQESKRDKNLSIANYTPNKSFIIGNPEVFRDDGTQDLDMHVSKTLEAFDNMAKELVDWVINNNIKLPDQLEDLISKGIFDEIDLSTKERLKIKDIFASLSKVAYEQHLKQRAEKLTIKESDPVEGETNPDLQSEATNIEDELTYEEYRGEQLESLKNALTPVMKSFAINFYVHSHQLTQLVAGDFAFFKGRSETEVDNEPYDIIKRMSIVFGPGRAGAVKDNYFLPEKTNVAVIEDMSETLSQEDIGSIHPELVGDSFDATDAQGYITPEYFEMLKLGFGVESRQGYILKPVYYGIDENGVPRAIKFSAVVLTDELVDSFPGLKKLRDEMNRKNVHMSVFASAVKVGLPKNLTKLYRKDEAGNKVLIDEDMAVPRSIEDESIMSIDSANLRLQFNPAKKLIGKVTNPSQMTFLGAMNDVIIEKLDKLLQRNANIIKMGRSIVSRELRLQNGRPTYKNNRSRDILRKRVLKSLRTIAGSDKEADILDNRAASINLPMVANKVISSLSSIYDSNTVDIKLKGSKLVLQSEFGTFAKSLGKPRLKWKDENGLTEVYVSTELLKAFGLKVGDILLPDAFKAMGFRTPSTGLHSAIALKIAGDYPSPDPSLSNIIIAPSRIVHVHGSDQKCQVCA